MSKKMVKNNFYLKFFKSILYDTNKEEKKNSKSSFYY